MTEEKRTWIPASAGTGAWIPASAGMTEGGATWIPASAGMTEGGEPGFQPSLE